MSKSYIYIQSVAFSFAEENLTNTSYDKNFRGMNYYFHELDPILR